jgi:hypothetical protein
VLRAVVTSDCASARAVRWLDSAIRGCYCDGGQSSRIVQLLVIPRTSIRRALVLSVTLHALAAAIAWWAFESTRADAPVLVDIEIAPAPPPPEALPEERARPPVTEPASAEPTEPAAAAPTEPGEIAVDAGVDARPDAAPDARPDAAPDAPPDAAPDAGVDPDAGSPDDAGAVDALRVASDDRDGGAPDDAGGDAGGPQVAQRDASADGPQVAAGEGSGSAGAGSAAVVAGAGPAGAGSAAVVAGAGSAGAGSANAGSASAGSAAVAADAPTGSPPGAVAAGSGSGGAGSGAPAVGAAPPMAPPPPLFDTSALAAALAEGSVAAPAVEGAPTTAGTAANLLTYFPDGQRVTALIRFDRLRGTEWSQPTERLLRPMPDYRLLFGDTDAAISDKLETLVISTPRPRDAAATTLVARTTLARGALRDFLGATAPVSWAAARGGLLGTRSGALSRGDQRLILSPWRGWFLLAQPGDLGDLLGAAKGSLDTIEATGKIPAWLGGIRKIEGEAGEPRGPALVVTVALPGKRYSFGTTALVLGISSVATPDRMSLAIELVAQGWLVRGNLRCATEADATELVAVAQQLQRQLASSRAIQLVIGKPIVRVVANLAFARAGTRVSYATSVSIADARAILALAAQQLDQYFTRSP